MYVVLCKRCQRLPAFCLNEVSGCSLRACRQSKQMSWLLKWNFTHLLVALCSHRLPQSSPDQGILYQRFTVGDYYSVSAEGNLFKHAGFLTHSIFFNLLIKVHSWPLKCLLYFILYLLFPTWLNIWEAEFWRTVQITGLFYGAVISLILIHLFSDILFK